MKKYIIVIALALMFVPTKKSEAFIPFGGYNVFSVPCICSAAAVWYVWYAPLLVGPVPMTGPLAVGIPPTSLWFANFDPIIPTTWSLGLFMPGVQSCWQPAPNGCLPWPVLGHAYFLGSSLPGAIP